MKLTVKLDWFCLVGLFLLIVLTTDSLAKLTNFNLKKSIKLENGLSEETYLSNVFLMAQGEVLLYDPTTTPLNFPPGVIAITGFRAEIVDENQAPVPLSEVYLHHWVTYHEFLGNIGICDQYLFAIGAEARHSKIEFPSPYGFISDNSIPWFASVHLINTRNVTDVKYCIECMCNETVGRLACCQNGRWCDFPETRVWKAYHLMYTVTYTRDVEKVLPVNMLILDATPCLLEYDIPKCNPKTSPNCLHNQTMTYLSPVTGWVVFGLGHQHIGGAGISVSVRNSSEQSIEEGSLLCVSTPRYGEGSSAGDEAGYVVEMSSCLMPEGFYIEKGQYLDVVSVYHSDESHGGVMGLFALAIYLHEDQGNQPLPIHQSLSFLS